MRRKNTSPGLPYIEQDANCTAMQQVRWTFTLFDPIPYSPVTFIYLLKQICFLLHTIKLIIKCISAQFLRSNAISIFLWCTTQFQFLINHVGCATTLVQNSTLRHKGRQDALIGRCIRNKQHFAHWLVHSAFTQTRTGVLLEQLKSDIYWKDYWEFNNNRQ